DHVIEVVVSRGEAVDDRIGVDADGTGPLQAQALGDRAAERDRDLIGRERGPVASPDAAPAPGWGRARHQAPPPPRSRGDGAPQPPPMRPPPRAEAEPSTKPQPPGASAAKVCFSSAPAKARASAPTVQPLTSPSSLRVAWLQALALASAPAKAVWP